MGSSCLLEVNQLCVAYRLQGTGRTPVLERLQLTLQEGEAVGVFGPSGGGKTTLARALLRLLPPAQTETTGTMLFEGQDFFQAPEAQRRKIRGARIGMVPQEPSVALNPVRTVEVQVAEVLYAHRTHTWSEARRAARASLHDLFGREAERVARSYPHQLSGGQRQRAVIAQAICCSPKLLIADEPTSTLDSVTQYEILQLLRQLRERTGTSILLFSHNRAALSFLTGRVLELRDGRLID